MDTEKSFVQKCAGFLNARWKSISREIESGSSVDPLTEEDSLLKKLIVGSLTSTIKSYHYVLPTQLLSKCVNPALDCRSLQAAFNKPGAFDARTIAHEVIVPFDQANQKVFGGSIEPYVNNPLRYPAVIKKYRTQQKNKTDWDKLVAILDEVENRNDSEFTAAIFDQVLVDIHRLLADVQVIYPIPNRVSFQQTLDLIAAYVSDKSGGDRMESVCTALFRTIAKEFEIFDDVRRQKVNTADASSGMGADIECRLRGKVILLVEVKDRSTTLTQISSKLDIARSQKISEILFLAEHGLEKEEKKDVEKKFLLSSQAVKMSMCQILSPSLQVFSSCSGRKEGFPS